MIDSINIAQNDILTFLCLRFHTGTLYIVIKQYEKNTELTLLQMVTHHDGIEYFNLLIRCQCMYRDLSRDLATYDPATGTSNEISRKTSMCRVYQV